MNARDKGERDTKGEAVGSGATPFMPDARTRSCGKSNERGASMLEFAFALVFIVLPLMFGIIDFSRAMYAFHFAAYAAREATRWASVRGASCIAPMDHCQATTSDVQNFVTGGGGQNGILPPGMYYAGATCGGKNGTGGPVGCLSATATWSGLSGTGGDCTQGGALANNTPGCVVQVKVNYRFGFSFPYLGPVTSTSILMTSKSQMVIAH